MPDGSWTDVETSPDEAAVFLGAATEQATAGLLKAATYRVVSVTLQLALRLAQLRCAACMRLPVGRPQPEPVSATYPGR